VTVEFLSLDDKTLRNMGLDSQDRHNFFTGVEDYCKKQYMAMEEEQNLELDRNVHRNRMNRVLAVGKLILFSESN